MSRKLKSLKLMAGMSFKGIDDQGNPTTAMVRVDCNIEEEPWGDIVLIPKDPIDGNYSALTMYEAKELGLISPADI